MAYLGIAARRIRTVSRSVVSSRSPRLRRFTRRGALALVAGVGAAAVLAGCGAGQISETAKIQPAVQGANAQSDSGTIALRDLTVLFPGGGDATYTAGRTRRWWCGSPTPAPPTTR
ncbi:hypothetical protein Athai_56050 [Actinocatenispora thailandica]|uniref:Uncharacterized protein n=1 Tax=Actinocatenispora thailandica TaxID=227318 RepID=A0A7R7DVI9_9ACTN|nr:hypothetical protein Athai_56050 [Actinocatenispora thailandica]